MVDFTHGADATGYDDHATCLWYIQCEGLSSPVLTFTQFDTERNYDWVAVADGIASGESDALPQMARLSGNGVVQSADANVAASGRALTVEFSSNGNGGVFPNGDGFAFDWSC